MKTPSLLTAAAILLFGLASTHAHADTLTLMLAQPVQTISAPGMVTYTGTISAPGANTGTVFLNNDSFTLAGPYVLDDTAFLDAPQSLLPGESYAGKLFAVDLNSILALGTFDGRFNLLGGAGDSDQSVLAAVSFSLTVNSMQPIAVTPEPSSLVLFLTGGLLSLVMSYRSRRPRSSLMTSSSSGEGGVLLRPSSKPKLWTLGSTPFHSASKVPDDLDGIATARCDAMSPMLGSPSAHDRPEPMIVIKPSLMCC